MASCEFTAVNGSWQRQGARRAGSAATAWRWRVLTLVLVAGCVIPACRQADEGSGGGTTVTDPNELPCVELSSHPAYQKLRELPAEVPSPPRTLEESLAYLDEILNPFQKRYLMCLDERDLASETHLGLGRWIRNSWGLSDEGSQLAADLHSRGVIHVDDMTSIIIFAYHRQLTGEGESIDDVIARRQEYWRQEGYDVDAFLERHRTPEAPEQQ